MQSAAGDSSRRRIASGKWLRRVAQNRTPVVAANNVNPAAEQSGDVILECDVFIDADPGDRMEGDGGGGYKWRSAWASAQPATSLPAIGSQVAAGARENSRLAERFGFSPKNSGPDHGVPVIVRAMAESER